MLNRHAASCGENPKIRGPQMNNTRDLINENWRVVQWFNDWFFTLGVAGVRESVETRVAGMRSLISCMTLNIPYRITLFIWNMVRCFMYVISCAFRRGVAIVGEFFYWALLTPLWDPLSGTGGV